MPSWMGLSFQDSGSFSMSELSSFHDYVIVIMSGIVFFIVYVIFYIIMNKKFYKNFSESTFVETVWSIIPAFLLIILVLPSMKVLYYMEDVKVPCFSFKVVAHQWYWSYVVPFFKNYMYMYDGILFKNWDFDSMMDIEKYPRLLNCSDKLIIPVSVSSRFLISSTDVIHSFAIPSLGMKVDALPGRVNQLFVTPSRLGVFYGQCSEICGSYHSFMPIEMHVVPLDNYDKYSKFLLMESMEVSGLKI